MEPLVENVRIDVHPLSAAWRKMYRRIDVTAGFTRATPEGLYLTSAYHTGTAAWSRANVGEERVKCARVMFRVVFTNPPPSVHDDMSLWLSGCYINVSADPEASNFLTASLPLESASRDVPAARRYQIWLRDGSMCCI